MRRRTPERRHAGRRGGVCLRRATCRLVPSPTCRTALADGPLTLLGGPFVFAGIVVLGALTFISLGYVVASFAPTEESASQMVSIVQFPLMFLSGIFFALESLPEFLRGVAVLCR